MQTTGLREEQRRNFGNIVPRSAAPSPPRDQADGLRRLMQEKPRHARVLAVTSGKGGVGKTNVSVNLAIALAAARRRVFLIDLDLGLANADILFNLTPRYNLTNVLSGQRTIEEIAVAAPGGVFVVPGASGVERLANLSDGERTALISSFEALHRTADFIVFDTGAGISKNTTEFLAAADDVLVVTVPEPTAVIDAYAVIKMLAGHSDRGQLHLVINMAESRAEAEKFAAGISVTANKLLNVYVEKAGFLLRDPKVGLAVRQQRPFLLAYPDAPCSQAVRGIAERLTAVRSAVPDERPGFVRRLFSVFSRSA